MSFAPLPPIYRDCRRLLVHNEAIVRRFARYHKYTVGTDLRNEDMALMRQVHRACFEWLTALFRLSAEGQLFTRWVLPGTTFAQQTAALLNDWPMTCCLIERGCRFQVLGADNIRLLLRPEQQSGYLAHLRHQRQAR